MIREARETTREKNSPTTEEQILEKQLSGSDYLVGKVLYTEKKVLEALNKMTFVKDTVLNSKAKVDSSFGDLLSHHQKQ